MSGLSHSSLWGLKGVQWRAAVPKSQKGNQWQWGQTAFGASWIVPVSSGNSEGNGVLHEDRSANQRLRKLGPLEVVYKLQSRNLFWVPVPSGLWGLPLPCPEQRSLGIRQATTERKLQHALLKREHVVRTLPVLPSTAQMLRSGRNTGFANLVHMPC